MKVEGSKLKGRSKGKSQLKAEGSKLKAKYIGSSADSSKLPPVLKLWRVRKSSTVKDKLAVGY